MPYLSLNTFIGLWTKSISYVIVEVLNHSLTSENYILMESSFFVRIVN